MRKTISTEIIPSSRKDRLTGKIFHIIRHNKF